MWLGTFTGWLTKIVLLSISIATVFVCIHIAQADTTSPWVNSNPTYEQLSNVSITNTTDNDAYTLLKSYRMGCIKEDFTTRPKRITQTAIVKQVCSSGVLGGRVAKELLLKNGTQVAGALVGSTSTNAIIKTVSDSDTVVELTSAQQLGYYVWPIENAYLRTKTTVDGTGMVTYTLPAAAAGTNIKNAANQPVLADPNTIGFSDNGEWMIADAPGTGFVRINLASRQVLPFAASLTSAYGRSIPTINAISGDGRYAVVSSSNTPQLFTLYDLATCIPPTNSGLVYSCQQRDLNTIMVNKVTTWRKVIGNIRFTTNDTIHFYGSYDFISGLNQKYGLFSLTTPNVTDSKLDYLALGDSFSSGEGAFSYWTATDFTDNRCHISAKSYPYILYQAVGNIGSFKSVACSGAKMKDVIIFGKEEDYNYSSYQSFGKSDPMYDSEILLNYYPGYRLQQRFVEQNKPKIITMSVGGNDIGFSSILKSCVLSIGDCYKYSEESTELVNNINAAYQPLLSTYQKVKESSAPNAKIYIVGYPQIAQPGGNCALNVHLTNNEILLGQYLIKHLNLVIKTAAEHAGVAYVDIEHAFDDYKLCEGNKSKLAVHGLIASSSFDRIKNLALSAAESYHPNALGHQLMANAITQKTNGFSVAMPAPSTVPVNFGETLLNPIVAGKPLENRPVYTTAYSTSVTADTLLKNTQAAINIKAYDYSLKPNTNFELVLHSTPTSLGTVTTDIYGNINGSFNLPSSITPGYHTLHIRGVNIFNEPIDIMKMIYVGASVDDLDGDGTLDANQQCLLAQSANIDYDQDGIDDACDDEIGEPPTITQSTQNLQNFYASPGNLITFVTQEQKAIVSTTNPPTVAVNMEDSKNAITSVAGTQTDQSQTVAQVANQPFKMSWQWILLIAIIPLSIILLLVLIM